MLDVNHALVDRLGMYRSRRFGIRRKANFVNANSVRDRKVRRRRAAFVQRVETVRFPEGDSAQFASRDKQFHRRNQGELDGADF